MKQQQKIALRGQVYATPRTESVEVKNQGVLCASGGGGNAGTSKFGKGTF